MGGEVFKVKVEGLRESMASLQMFGDIMVGKWGHKATFDAANVIKEQAIANAPTLQHVDDRRIAGALKAAIAIFKRPDPSTGKSLYVIGVRRIKLGAKLKKMLRALKKAGLRLNLQNDVFYAHFMEYDYHERGGKIHKGTRFMTRAFEAKKQASIDAFSLTLSQGVVAAAVHANKGAK